MESARGWWSQVQEEDIMHLAYTVEHVVRDTPSEHWSLVYGVALC